MTVFANGLEVSAKKQGCKVIAAFPDTCFTPPQTPATPPGVPIPYPNFATDGDLTSGTGTVKIKDGEVSQENSSKFSKVSGDEAGSAPKKGIITSNNKGAAYAKKWSMDVKAEGKGLVRFSDIATTNHACDPGDDAPWIVVGGANVAMPGSFKCIVGSYSRGREDCTKQGGQFHHIIPDRTFRSGRITLPGLTPKGNKRKRNIRMGKAGGKNRFPSHSKGVCICLPPENHCKSKKTPAGTDVVHELLDDELTALGATGTAESPKGLAKLSDVRDQCLSSLEELTPDPISTECFDLAFEKVHEQTEDIAECQVRAEKNLKNVSSRARGVMNKQ
ncbi:MAG: DUF4150 domain-containing protein [Pseudomonadota bacterium]